MGVTLATADSKETAQHRTATAGHALPNRLRSSAVGLRSSSLVRLGAATGAAPAHAGRENPDQNRTREYA